MREKDTQRKKNDRRKRRQNYKEVRLCHKVRGKEESTHTKTLLMFVQLYQRVKTFPLIWSPAGDPWHLWGMVNYTFLWSLLSLCVCLLQHKMTWSLVPLPKQVNVKHLLSKSRTSLSLNSWGLPPIEGSILSGDSESSKGVGAQVFPDARVWLLEFHQTNSPLKRILAKCFLQTEAFFHSKNKFLDQVIA